MDTSRNFFLTPQKQILVRLGQAGEFATIAVVDHGIGIPLEDQGRIFEKFYRSVSSLVHDVKGDWD